MRHVILSLSVSLLLALGLSHCGPTTPGTDGTPQEAPSEPRKGDERATTERSQEPPAEKRSEPPQEKGTAEVPRERRRESGVIETPTQRELPPEPVVEKAPEPTPQDAGTPDPGQPERPPEKPMVPDTPGKPMSRAMAWVRKNPMFVTGLAPSVGAPTAAVVKEYFQNFGATAVHLWEDGMGPEMDAWRKVGPANMPFLSWVHLDGTSNANRKIIGGYKANIPGRIGYQVGDEPRDIATLRKIEGGVKKVRQADPGALIVVNFTYLAGTDLETMLHYYLKDMKGDIVSYDQYTRSQGTFEHLARYRRFGLQYGAPYWRYIRMFLPTRQGKDEIHESDLRWDAFLGLTYGYTGHSHFLYQVHPKHKLIPALFANAGNYSQAKTPLYAITSQVNRELRNLGKAITQLTSTDVRYIASLLQPKSTKAWSKGAGNNPYIANIKPAAGELLLDIAVGFFDDDAGEKYVMVQNMRHKHGSIPLNTTRAGRVELTFDFSQAPANVKRNQILVLNAKTGKVETRALSGGTTATLNVTLAAGDPILFKYDTGKPFALQK